MLFATVLTLALTGPAAPQIWIPCALHVHTKLSYDAGGHPLAVAELYRTVYGATCIAFQEHNEVNPSGTWKVLTASETTMFDILLPGVRVTNANGETWFPPTSEVVEFMAARGMIVFYAEEVTARTAMPALLPVHIGAIWRDPPTYVVPFDGGVADANIATNVARAAAAGADLIAMNHTNYCGPACTRPSITVEDYKAVSALRMLEIANAHVYGNNDGINGSVPVVRQWDVANAFRLSAGLQLLGGTGTDDAHEHDVTVMFVGSYYANHPMLAYTMVEVPSANPTRQEVLDALIARRYYATNGPAFTAISYVDGCLDVVASGGYDKLTLVADAADGVSFPVAVTEGELHGCVDRVFPLVRAELRDAGGGTAYTQHFVNQ